MGGTLKPNNDSIMMSDVLKDKMPDITAEVLNAVEKTRYTIVLEKYLHDERVDVITGILDLVTIDKNRAQFEVRFKTLIETAMVVCSESWNVSNKLSFGTLEISKFSETEESDYYYDLREYSLDGVNIDAFDYEKDLCYLSLKLIKP